jgi:RNA polymerase sigma-70 factor (ECF subfamily)
VPEPLVSNAPTHAGFRRRPASEERDKALVNRAVAAAKTGDQDAIRFLYTRYADNVYGYVCSILHDEHEAEDVTQNVFLKLMRVIGQYEERSVPFLAWVLRVARNVAVDHLRQRRALVCEEVRDPERDATDRGPERSHYLRDALATLPADQRNVLVMRHLIGLSPGEIAERMDKTEGSVHALHHRGRRAAQRELRAMREAPATQV